MHITQLFYICRNIYKISVMYGINMVFKQFHATYLFPLKVRETTGFRMFSGGIERTQEHGMGKLSKFYCQLFL